MFILLCTCLYGCPKYNVWQAQLKQAEWNRQITILEAEAKREENGIIGESLKENEEYLRYLMYRMIR